MSELSKQMPKIGRQLFLRTAEKNNYYTEYFQYNSYAVNLQYNIFISKQLIYKSDFP